MKGRFSAIGLLMTAEWVLLKLASLRPVRFQTQNHFRHRLHQTHHPRSHACMWPKDRQTASIMRGEMPT